MIIKPENHHKKMFYESYVNIIYGLNICVHLRSFAFSYAFIALKT